MQIPLFRLQCGVNSYDWGKIGKDSAAAQFASATPENEFEIQEDKPYAELWMGTHPSLPSRDASTKRTLLDLVETNAALLSPEVSARFGNKLPFLFKVLSINKALSIQAHPNKKLAEELRARDPEHYPDDNHKPEMTIAVTPFEGLCGFRPLGEIKHFLSTVPALRKCVGEEQAAKFEAAVTVSSGENADGDGAAAEEEDEKTAAANKAALRELFTALMNSDKQAIESATADLVAAASSSADNASFAGGGGASNTGPELAELVLRLNRQFPSDIGLLVLFLLNYIKMSAGEAMFLKADDIHAYLSGDIIECMASSDNVVRAGFTPKFKDIPTLTSMLTYSYAPPSLQKLQPQEYPYVTLNTAAYSSGSVAELYDPPIDEFAVVRAALRRVGAKATFEGIQGPSLLVCTGGRGKLSVGPKSEVVEKGYVFFVGATAEVVLESGSEAEGDEEGGEEFVVFKAFCEIVPTTNGA